MTNWKKVIAAHHEWAHPPEDEYDLVTQPPASKQQLSELGRRLGIALPKELMSLYRTYNGFGVRGANSSEIDWFLVPVENIPEFTEQIRSWFRDTHHEVAARFFPFFDWANGDGMGYLFDVGGSKYEGLCNFHHEEYESDDDQDPSEFLVSIGVGIEEFLSYR